MRMTPSILAVLAACCFTPSVGAETPSFVGLGARPETARIESSIRGARDVRRGETVEGLGELKAVSEEEAVFERMPDDAERARLADLGAAVPDVVRLRLRRALDVTAEDGAFFPAD